MLHSSYPTALATMSSTQRYLSLLLPLDAMPIQGVMFPPHHN